VETQGRLVRRALQDFITEELDKQGYSQVFTPHIGKLDLYRTSGHFPYYAGEPVSRRSPSATCWRNWPTRMPCATPDQRLSTAPTTATCSSR
jgi:hypothetical protein